MWLRFKETVLNKRTMNVSLLGQSTVFLLLLFRGNTVSATANYEGCVTVHDIMHLIFTVQIHGKNAIKQFTV